MPTITTRRLAALLLAVLLPATTVVQAESATPPAASAASTPVQSPATVPVVPAANAVNADTTAPVTVAADASAETLQQREHNLVNYIRQRFAVPESKALTIVRAAYHTAVMHHTQPELILAVIAVESTFKEKARNGGAMGLMQIIPRYHRARINAIGGVRQLYSPAKNIQAGTGILMEYINKSGGDLRQALMRYKGNFDSIGAGYADRIMANYDRMLAINADE